MTTLSGVFIGNAGATIEVLDDQVFNTSGTWTKPGVGGEGDVALIELWGGGGGGGKAASGAGRVPGGMGGDYVRFAVPLSQLAASETVTVGAGGGGGSSNNGNWGGQSSFATFSVNGGTPGLPNDDIAWSQVLGAVLRKPRIYGGGDGGFRLNQGGLHPPGRSMFGGSGGAGVTSGSGEAGSAPGGGGGAGGSGTGNSGGDGAPGRVRVRIIRGLNQWEVSEGPL